MSQLQRNSTFAIFQPIIKNSALRAIHNAPAVVERINAYKMKDANGNDVKITVEDLTNGVDLHDRKSIARALKTNDILRTIAVMDATGQLVMKTGAFAEASLSGINYATQDDLNYFAKNADSQTFAEVSKALNITPEEWRTMTPESFNLKMEAYSESDIGKSEIERIKAITKAKKIPESEAKEKLPISPITQKNGSIKRYKTDNVDIAIIKDNGKYTIFDYKSRKATKALALAETVAEIERLKSRNQNAVQAKNSVKSLSYANAKENGEIISLVETVESGEFKSNDKVPLKQLPEVVSEKVKEITGVDVSGFNVVIEARQIEHILKDHGKNGKTDNSMADYSDIAKMEFAMQNPDSIDYAGKTQAYSYMREGRNRTADTIRYEKEIGDKSYYVIQAVADTKKKTLYVVSAFIGKKGYKKGTSQLIDATKSPNATSKDGSVVVPNNSIPEKSKKINPSDEKNSKADNSDKNSIAEEYKKAEKYAKANIPEYNKLYAPAKRAVERTIVEARANGVSDADVLTFAKFSTKSGINVAFDKQMLICGVDENGKIKYSDGLFDGDNTIFINKDSKRRYSAVLLHELMHSLNNNTSSKAEYRIGKKLIRATKKMDPQRKKKIEDEYKKYYESVGAELTDEILVDELLAHYTEDVMGDIDVLEFLEGEVQGLGKRIIGFFNESARRYSGDENLSREARKYARKFRELYRQIEQRHKGMNATEGVNSGERRALDIDNLTEEQYNNFGWVRANDILTADEYKNFTTEFAKAKTSGEYDAYKSSLGEYMIAVGKRTGANEGVKNRVVFAKGDIESPQITRILKIRKNNETQLSKKRSEIYAFERVGLRQETGGIFTLYTRFDVADFATARRNFRQGNGYNNQFGVNGGAGSRTTQKTVKGTRSSLTPLVHTFRDVAGRKRNVLKINREYMIEGDNRSKYQPTIEAAVNAENERVIARYAKKYNTTITKVKRLLENNPDFLKKERQKGNHSILNADDKAASVINNYTYNEEHYNSFGWAKESGALSKNELDDLYSKIKVKSTLRAFKQSSRGEAIIEVNDKPHTTLGVNNVFAFVKGTKNNFYVSRVVRFDAETETEMEIIKEDLYEGRTFSDTYYSFFRQKGFAEEYRRESAKSFAEYKELRKSGETSRGADSDNRQSEQHGGGYSRGTGENEEVIQKKKRYALDITAETETEELPNTLDSVAKEKVRYKGRIFDTATKFYMETVDELYGLQRYLETAGKKQDAAAIVNMARSSRSQAQTMIGSVQYDLFSGNYEELGEGIQKILEPITKIDKLSFSAFYAKENTLYKACLF